MRASARSFALGLAVLAAPSHAAWPGIQWEATIAPTAGFKLDDPRAALDPAGNLFVVAREANATRACMFTAKLAGSTGAVVWRRSLCDLDSEAFTVAADSAGDVVVGGVARSGGQSSARIVKYDGADGRMHWERLYDLGATGANEIAADIAIDAQRDIYVIASSQQPSARLLKYSAGGTLRWQSETVPVMTALRLDAAGNPFVAGQMPITGGAQWAVTRFSPASGQVVWRQVSGVAGSLPRALAVDAAGDVAVTGSFPAGRTETMRTVKYSGVDGTTLWQRDLATSGEDVGLAIGIDTRGNVVVTGMSGLAWETVKYRASEGVIAWRNTFLPRGGKAGFGASVAFDPTGNPIVAGQEDAPAGSTDSTIRTMALAAESGVEIWSIAFDGPASAADTIGNVVAGSDGVFVAGAMADRGELVVARYGFAAVPAINAQGLWWRSPAGAESGWGINLVHQGDIVFATWFTYDTERRPLWLVMSEGVRISANSYSGTVYEASGPPFDSATWDSSRVQLRAVGTGTVTFTDANNATFRFTNARAGIVLVHPITRQLFASPAPTCTFGDAPSTTNFQDLWWRAPAGSEAGWGLNVTQQGDVLFATWFTYGADGAPLWLVASEMRKTSQGTYTGDLYRTSGPFHGATPWDPNLVTVTRVGSATLAFTAADAGTFSFTVDGVSVSKPITRQVFATPRTVCR